MPTWAQVILAVAAVIIAVGTIWTKALRPGARVVSSLDRMIPVLNELVDEFHASPELLATVSQIARQFRPDNGSSLRDVIDRLEETTSKNTKAIEGLSAKLADLHEDLRRGTR